jgi:hypothetical protein
MGCIVWSRRATRHGSNREFSPVAGAHGRLSLGLVHPVSWGGMRGLAHHHDGPNSIGHLPTFRRRNGDDSLRCIHGSLLGGVLDGLLLWLVQAGWHRHERLILADHFTITATSVVSAAQEAVITTCPRGRCRRRT